MIPSRHADITVIIDDLRQVWGVFQSNVVRIIPYYYFVDDTIKSLHSTLTDDDKETSPKTIALETRTLNPHDCYFKYLGQYLQLLHRLYFAAHDRASISVPLVN